MKSSRFMLLAGFVASCLCCAVAEAGSPSTSGVVFDTVGMTAFIDSLHGDVKKNSLDFLLSHRTADFSGESRFETRAGVDPLRKNPTLARETAIFLAWMLQPNRRSAWFDPKTGTAIVSSGDSTNPCDPDRGESQDNYCVWVPDPGQSLFDSIGGRSLGPIKTRWVHRISAKGGQKLKNFYWPIRSDWMRIGLPDGRKGWTKGTDLGDVLGAYITLNLVHQTDGWRVSAMFAQLVSTP